jgi:biotin synthase
MEATTQNSHEFPPKQVRVSLGTAAVLGLVKVRLDAAPTTAYFMTYRKGRCSANCGFCPQARGSKSKADMLSRVAWPVFETNVVLKSLEKAVTEKRIKRVCIQALNYPQVFTHLRNLVNAICKALEVPISVSCQPLSLKNVRQIAEAGAQRIGIPLDAATKEVFDRVKGSLVEGPYDWNKQQVLLREAVEVFGRGKVSTHLIVGLGETEPEMVNAIQQCVDVGVLPALFAFTPVRGIALEDVRQPSIQTYRRLQIARYVIVHGLARAKNMRFNLNGQIVEWGVAEKQLRRIVQTGKSFVTSGCPNCNRPYYNEKPSGPIFNFPKPLTVDELTKVKEELAVTEE